MSIISLGESSGILSSIASKDVFNNYRLSEGFGYALAKLEKMGIYYAIIESIELDETELRKRIENGWGKKEGLSTKMVSRNKGYGTQYSHEGSTDLVGIVVNFKGLTKSHKESKFYWKTNINLGEGTSKYIANHIRSSTSDRMDEYQRISKPLIDDIFKRLSIYSNFTKEGYEVKNINDFKKEKLIFFSKVEELEKYLKLVKIKNVGSNLDFKELQDSSSKAEKIEENKSKYEKDVENRLANKVGANIIYKGKNGGVVYEITGKNSALYIGSTFAYIEYYEDGKQRLIYNLDSPGETIKTAQLKVRNLNNKLLWYTVSKLDLRSSNKFYDNVNGRW